MAFEINRTWGANNTLINPLITINKLSSDITDGWAAVNSGGGGAGVAPTITGGANEEGNFSIGSGTGRSAFSKSASLVIGRFYYLVGQLVSLTGDAINSENFGLINEAFVTNLTPAVRISAASPGFYGIRFEATASDDQGMRFGLGIFNAIQDGPSTAVWKNIAVIEVESLSSPPPLFDYLEIVSNSIQSGAVARPFVNDSTFNESTGEIVYIDGNPLPNLQTFSSILYSSDSYGEGGTEWPAKLAEINGSMALRGAANAGEKVSDMILRYDDIIALTDLPYNGPVHDAMICQPSINDFNQTPTDGDAVLATMGQMIDKVQAAGMVAIVLNLPRVANITSGARETEWLKYQNGIQALAGSKGATLTDVSSPLTDDNNPLSFVAAANADPDGNHLTAAGYVIYATVVSSTLVALRIVAPILTTPYPDLTFLSGQSVNINLNLNISGDTSLTVDVTPGLQGGLSESSGVISGTAVIPTGTATVIVTGTNSFGSVSDKFQLTTLTTGSPTSGINVLINEV